MIIPAANVRCLSLNQDILNATEAGQFTLWSVTNITDALPLLTNLLGDGEGQTTLIRTVQKQIASALQQDARHRYQWPLRWLDWFN